MPGHQTSAKVIFSVRKSYLICAEAIIADFSGKNKEKNRKKRIASAKQKHYNIQSYQPSRQ